MFMIIIIYVYANVILPRVSRYPGHIALYDLNSDAHQNCLSYEAILDQNCTITRIVYHMQQFGTVPELYNSGKY